jgi:hypothetical protein
MLCPAFIVSSYKGTTIREKFGTQDLPYPASQKTSPNYLLAVSWGKL